MSVYDMKYQHRRNKTNRTRHDLRTVLGTAVLAGSSGQQEEDFNQQNIRTYADIPSGYSK